MAHRWIMDLATPEQFLISALRLWGQGRSDHGLCCCRSLLRNGFHAAGLLATEFETFDRVLTLIDAASTNGLAIESPKEACISRTEERYLRALSFAQAGDVSQLKWTLSVWLPQSAVRIASPELIQFARSCAAVGLVLSLWGDEDKDTASVHARSLSHKSPRTKVIPLRTLSAQLH